MSDQASLLEWSPPKPSHFDGPSYEPVNDRTRLTDQHIRIRELMLDGQWRTFREIAQRTGDPEASVSAQLRHLRKERFGAFVVERRKRGDRARGLFEYRVLPPDPTAAREHGAESKKVIQRLRDELRLLRAASVEAAEILESLDMGDESENDRLEMIARTLRDRSTGLVSP